MTTWVLLYNEAQDAYHTETLTDYRRGPANGYAVVYRAEARALVDREYRRRVQQKNPAGQGGVSETAKTRIQQSRRAS